MLRYARSSLDLPLALLSTLILVVCSNWTARLEATDCIGAKDAALTLIYLHGLETPGSQSEEEVSNRLVLQQLAKELPLRVVLPASTLSCGAKLCWPGRDQEEVKQTYQQLLKASETCGPLPSRFSLLGFSNGGYFAFKLFRWESDPRLDAIVASGSAGQWDPKTDKLPPSRSFHLILGERELTLKAARGLAKNLRVSLPTFQLETFAGGHRLDHDTLLRLLTPLSKRTLR